MPTRSSSWSSTTSCGGPGCGGRSTRSASAGPAPTLLHAGTDGQQERYLPPMLAGEEVWCQLFSEPEAGSDLAGLRTVAERDGDEYVVNGQKIWTSLAHLARFGILLARTDPDAAEAPGHHVLHLPDGRPRHRGAPDRRDDRGAHVQRGVPHRRPLPAANLVGRGDDGWQLARVTLANERVSLSSGGVLWGNGPTAVDLIDRVPRRRPGRRHRRSAPAPAAAPRSGARPGSSISSGCAR